MKKEIDVVDLFDQEISKKEKKLNRKMEKIRKKEAKKQKKLDKELENKENEEFEEYLEKVKEERLVDAPVKIEEEIEPINHIQIDDISDEQPIKELESNLIEPPSKDKYMNFEDLFIEEDPKTNIEEFFKEQTEKPNIDFSKDPHVEEFFTETKKEKKYPFLNFLLITFSIILLVIGIDYIIYNCITNYVDVKTMANSIILGVMIMFYLLSIVSKKKGAIKTFQILSLICMILFMSYHLWII